MNNNYSSSDTRPVDPDPFTIASTFIAAAALILQFLQVRQANNPQQTSASNRAQILDHIEQEVQNTLTKSDRLIRTIEEALEIRILNSLTHPVALPVRLYYLIKHIISSFKAPCLSNIQH